MGSSQLENHRIWSTTLEDGRTITSQAFDPYFEIMATPAAPGRTIQGNTLKEQMDEHWKFRSGFPEDSDPASLSDEGIVRLAGEAMNLRQDALVAQGKLWRDHKGLVRSRLGMASTLGDGEHLAHTDLIALDPVHAAQGG